MAKTYGQQQLVVIYLSICLGVVSLLMRVDSVSGTSIPFNDGMQQRHRQQQQHQQVNGQEQDQKQEHNYVMDETQQEPTTITPRNVDVVEIVGDDNIPKTNSLTDDLTRSSLIFGQSYDPIITVKRAPGGFVGMRGKKLYYEDDKTGSDNDNDDNGIAFPWSQLQNSNEAINWDEYATINDKRYKKAPTAFYGVRGKKFGTINGITPSNGNRRWQDFLERLEEERIRDAMLQDFMERITGGQTDLPNEMSKRAPTGFTGMRGKRPAADYMGDPSMETLTKRGLGNNAFVGVRGKKDVSHQTFKRSPLGAESLPDGGGKRQRFIDFNNKFVAVRGKKSSYNVLDGFSKIFSSGSNNRSPSTANNDLLYGKRTPNGFLGMRGKRPFTTDDIFSLN